MKTEYYCDQCKVNFYDNDKLPNLNRVHDKCGVRARLVEHYYGEQAKRKKK